MLERQQSRMNSASRRAPAFAAITVPMTFVLTWVVAGASFAAEERFTIRDGETRFDRELRLGTERAIIATEHTCFAANTPTVSSRHVIRFFDAASFAFVRIKDRATGRVTRRWVGADLPALSNLLDKARPHLPSKPRSLDSPADAVAAAEAELDRAKEGPALFGDRPPFEIRVKAPPPGGERNLTLNGCYTRSALETLVQARADAANRLLRAAQQP